MKKTAIQSIAFLILFGIFTGMNPAAVLGQQPPIGVDLTINSYTNSGQPIGATVTVTNGESQQLLMNEGFGSGVYYLRMRVIDPAGRLVLPQIPDTGAPQSDSGPLPIIYQDGRRIQVAPCETLAANAVLTSQTPDLKQYYSLPLPGYYSAQVQIDAAIFNGLPCDLNDYRWQGVLKSATKYFFYEGATPVTFSSLSWPAVWGSDSKYQTDLLAVTVTPTQGSVSDYDLTSLRLNNVLAKNVVPGGTSFIAYFSKQEAYNTLTSPVADQSYPVSITGLTKTGGIFGGARQVTVVSPYGFTGFLSPVDNPPTVNSAKAGQSVPVKWQLTGSGGAPVSDRASFVSLTSYSVTCGAYTGNTVSAVEEYASGSSGLQYLGSGNWQYNWAVPRSYVNTCRNMVLTLKDGTTYTAFLKFK
jgi:hypothetical protein